jgi:uncharacterized ferritin-like protein (DUF455 family)
MTSIRHLALKAIQERDPFKKVELTRQIRSSNAPLNTSVFISEPCGLPGRPSTPELVPYTKIKQFSMVTPQGKAALVHSIAHIELNAIDLALDIIWRFDGMPDEFYYDWLKVAEEEALHFTLLRNHLVVLGFDYGSFLAHNALWEMAEKTKTDILARLGLVPRTLEARGLDATPAVKRKLISSGDSIGAAIFDIILRDEIGHVAIGNRWYRWVCKERNLDPIINYADLVTKYEAQQPRKPFNMEARRLAGFEEAELDALIENDQKSHY